MTPTAAGIPADAATPAAWSRAFAVETAHGWIAGVRLPATPHEVTTPVLERLHPAEAEHARTLSGPRRNSFVGGRLALREAAAVAGAELPAVLRGARGAPQLPPGVEASIAHKRALAAALVGRPGAGSVGIDVEDELPPRPVIAPRVLTAEESAFVARLPEPLRWPEVLLRFSLKESLYKALAPHLGRYVGFGEAAVTPRADGTAEITLRLEDGDATFAAEGRYLRLGGHLVTTVLLRPAS